MLPCQKLPAWLRALPLLGIVCGLLVLLWPTSTVRAQEGDRVALMEAPRGTPATPAEPTPSRSLRASTTSTPPPRMAARAEGGFTGEASTPGAIDFGSLDGLLPRALRRDLVRVAERAKQVESRLFGREGIVSVGRVEGMEKVGRLRLNLLYDPDPGFQMTLVLP